MSFRDVGDVVARYFQQRGQKRQQADDLAAFGKFTTAAGDYLNRRNAPQPEPMAFDALNPAGEVVDSLDLEAIRDGIPFPDEAPQMAQPAQPGASPKVGQPGSNAFEELGLNDLMSLHQLSAENHSPHNAAVLSDLINIWKGKDKSGAAMDLAAARLQGQMELMGKRFEGQAGLEGQKHGYRMDEIGKRGDVSMKVAQLRVRAAERQAKLKDARQLTDLQDMLEHYTDALVDARKDMQAIEDDVPISSNPDMARMGMDQVWTQQMQTWRQARAEAAREIRQIQGLMGQAMRGGAKLPREDAPPGPPDRAPRPGGVRRFNPQTGRIE